MPTLTIRNLPETTHIALRVRAAKAGRGMEKVVSVLNLEWVAPHEDHATRAAPVITTDQAWKQAPIGVTVELIR